MSDHPVIDISHWQTGVDFGQVKDDGVVGVIHKATEGAGYIDDTYHGREPEAKAAGLLWGAYHFLRPGDMLAQAQHFVSTTGEIDLYAADHEDSGVALDQLKAFLSEVERLTGKPPIIYSGHIIKEQVPGDEADPDLARHRLWLAHYDDEPIWPTATWPTWWLWQYTDQGTVAGVSPVDCDRYDGEAEQLIAEWTGEQPPQQRPPRLWPTVLRSGPHARRHDG